ncbi:AI-2E family transporter [Natronorubrum aibiense]|uniref:AI-2E family transporter n=1 Tax=Natronorubrum aibiense TaxID=348826 RepID=A0A5P9P0J3_9EURY|nr:AI-2E family transporter [Natronorubrum aibiense]QFU81644.1 AI-2E family transporter [Natronorubrum aibiense]
MNLSKGYLLALVLLFAYLSWQLVTPFLQFVLGAVLIAFVCYPMQARLEAYVSPSVAAFSLVVVSIVAFIIPFVLVIAVVADEAARIAQERDPRALQTDELEARIEAETGFEVDLTETVVSSAEQIGTAVFEQTTAWFSVVTHALIGLGVALFLLYYLLKDGDNLLRWLREITPLPKDVQNALYGELSDVMWAVLAGHVLIAIIQGVIAGLGLFATGIPNAAFWTFIMVILALIPLVGAFLVWGPAVGYLLVIGEPILAIILAIYSTIVVGLSDDYLRPILVDRYASLNPAVIIIGVLGGIYAYGIMGLFFGPVLVGGLLATLDVVNDHYDRLGDETRS